MLRNVYITVAGVPTGGLNPVWEHAHIFGAEAGSTIPPQQLPALRDLGTGTYEFEWDAEKNGDFAGYVTVPSPPEGMRPDEQTQPVEATRESERVLNTGPTNKTIVNVTVLA
jgi:hypothetical protein